MANKTRLDKVRLDRRIAAEFSPFPDWPTTLRSALPDGRCLGTDPNGTDKTGSVWLYKTVPLAPVTDARSAAEKLEASQAVDAAMEELAALTPGTVNRRAMARGKYRQIHLLLLNIPERFRPANDHPNRESLLRQFPGKTVDKRILLFGVRLNDRVGGDGGISEAIGSIAETLASGTTPLSDYDHDFKQVDAALTRAGLEVPDRDVFRLANSWWNPRRYPDTLNLPHADHIHFFATTESVRLAKQVGLSDCEKWTRDTVPHESAVTFVSGQDFDLQFMPETSPFATWACDLVRAGALAVSVRGFVEPAKITRQEIRRQRKRFLDDIRERREAGKMELVEQDEMLATLEQVEDVYALGGSPSLVGASIVAGFDGIIPDVDQLTDSRLPLKLAVMAHRQPGAFAETLLCSPAKANPNLLDLPAQMISASGIGDQSVVGDRTGALVGFTEHGGQPAYLGCMAASNGDSEPVFVGAGATGSGKTVALLWICAQFVEAGHAGIFVDPKSGSDHSETVKACGGQVASLDDLMRADGVFDPIRFSRNPEVAKELAASVLLSVNPWGSMKDDYETPLARAIAYGVDHGATCTGEALKVAEANLELPPGMVKSAFDLAESSPMFSALFGRQPGTNALAVSDGLTYIKVGDANLDLPEPGTPPASSGQRVALTLVRMMVFGSAMALTGRDGFIAFDEAWVFLGAGKAEVERLGRLARSQRVFPMMWSQRISDAVKAGLAGYISRGMILPISDPDEAKAACELFKLEPTPARLARITAKATLGGTSANKAPNWGSMRTLHKPGTREVLRGAVGIYVDLDGSAVPVEICLPREFLNMASTNKQDMDARDTA